MKVISKTLIFLNMLIFNFCNAEFTSGSIWHKKMPSNQDQYVVFIGEVHGTENRQQVYDLRNRIPDYSLALVEDPYALLPWTRRFFMSAEGTNLADLTTSMPYTVSTINVECRNYSYDFDGNKGTIGNIHDGKNSFLVSYCVAKRIIGEYLVDIQRTKQDSLSFTDGPQFNAAYTKFRTAMHTHTLNLQNLRNQLEATCANNNAAWNWPHHVRHEIYFAVAAEVDIRILHQIFAHKDKKYIFVLAGVAHTNNIENTMQDLGYECITKKENANLNINELLAQLPSTQEEPKKADEKTIPKIQSHNQPFITGKTILTGVLIGLAALGIYCWWNQGNNPKK